LFLVASSGGSGEARTEVMVKVSDSWMHVEEFLRSFSSLESLLLPLLTSCGTVRLLNHVVTARGGDSLLVIDVNEPRDLPDCGSVTPQLVSTDHVWDVVLAKESGQEHPCGFSISVELEKDVEHETVLVHGSPQPVPDAIHARTYLIQKPAGTPSGFPLAQVFSKQRAKLQTPFAKGLVTDLNTALVEQFLDVSVTEGEAVIQPDSVLDDRH